MTLAHSANTATALPLVSLFLIAYNQQDFVEGAIRGALAQDYPALEIFISDDASTDCTYTAAQQALAGYAGPHKVALLRNPVNLGISAHLSKLVGLSHGELIFVAAADDVSLPTRCSEVVQSWLSHDRKPDLIVTDLVDMAYDGTLQGEIRHCDLEPYKSFEYWADHPPHVIGASHTWTRRIFTQFGPIAPGMISEDQITTLRASLTGGAINLRRPLVHYRRGGTSDKRKWRTPADFVKRIRLTNRSSLAETLQFIHDAELAGYGESMRRLKTRKLAREQYTTAVFAAPGNMARMKILFGAGQITMGHRLRMFLYAAAPSAYAPFYFLGNLFRRS